MEEATKSSILLSLFSPDGEEGYPADLRVWVRYTLKDSALVISYRAEANDDTVINLTNHAYFNLHGCTGKTVEDHMVQIFASKKSETDDALIPTGALIPVAGTPYDFREPHALGERMPARFGGYDDSFHFDELSPQYIAGEKLPLVCRVWGGNLLMEVFTDRPDMQLYSGNFLRGKPDFRGGTERKNHGGLCLETHIPADAPNWGEGILRKGEVYQTVTVYRVRRQ